MNDWDGLNSGVWILFSNVDRLIVYGNGQIDGKGKDWWGNFDGAVSFHGCNYLQVYGLNIVDTPKIHLSINRCNNSTLSLLNLTAPGHSPNTDGVDISHSTNVTIRDSFMGTGDDCIAINGGCSNINVTNIACGPGHGVSVGSLGSNGDYDIVEDIHVANCNFTETTNGVRIKTCQGGSGYARNMTFENIRFEKVKNPIIIDQFYFSNGQNQSKAVNVSDITYKNISGSSVSNDGIILRCSEAVPCTGIMLDQQRLSHHRTRHHFATSSATRGVMLRLSINNLLHHSLTMRPSCRISKKVDGNDLINLLVIILGCLVVVGLASDDSIARVNVLDYGAVGDGKHDDSYAFIRAWKDFCMADAQIAVFRIPRDLLFLLKPVEFSGPCKARKLYFQIFGDLIMPKMEDWDDKDKGGAWIFIYHVQGLVVYGNGQVDGQGSDWWAIIFHHCDYLQIHGLKIVNPPRIHIKISRCHNVRFSLLNLTAPEYSPNTNGIDISHSINVNIQDSFIGTGDDCIAIIDGCSNINIANIACGPGHGISVGSLGRQGQYDTVEGVKVTDCNFTRTSNGVRIKTWPLNQNLFNTNFTAKEALSIGIDFRPGYRAGDEDFSWGGERGDEKIPRGAGYGENPQGKASTAATRFTQMHVQLLDLRETNIYNYMIFIS
ncbi:hypothetical protein Sjap_006616 [Stephania japonica]|uniref:Polygalacturonase n=1 Tax=Stephania japonica TaxID=461633 RepID=A0AAP0K658_9MAGN